MINYALAYAAAGHSVLPIWHVVPAPNGRLVCACPKGAACDSPGKHPLHLLVRHGLAEASSNADVIRRWWTAFPEANIALALSRSGLVAIDVDFYHGDAEKLQALEARYGVLPDTLTQRSGSGQGLHLLYVAPDFPIRGEIGGVVWRGKNYIVIAPSLHVSGGRYEWLRDCPPAHLPPAWLEALRRPMTEGTAGIPSPDAEPAYLRGVAMERRFYDARTHLEREPGEVKGVSAAGTAFNVCRTTVRAYGLRDPKAALALLLEVYNPRCSPPYRPEEIARRVVAAYDDAITPPWGDAYEPPEDRRRRMLDAFLGPPRAPAAIESSGSEGGTPNASAAPLPVPSVAPLPAISAIDLATHLKAVASRLARSSSPESLTAARLVKHALAGEPLVEGLDEDVGMVVTSAIQAIATAAPPSTTAQQLVDLVAASASRSGVSADELRPACERAIAEAEAEREAKRVREVARQQARASELAPRDDVDLRSRLEPGAGGDGVRPSGSNVEMILRWSSALGGKLRWNALSKAVEVSDGPFADETSNTLDVAVKNWLEVAWGLHTSTTCVGEQILRVARRFGAYDPVADYLNALTWDGVPRISTWLESYCNAEVTDFNRRVGAMWLVSAVSRGLHPGSKVDTVLVLEGDQGAKKSTALAILGGKWFSDTPMDLGDKDSRMLAAQKWIVELAELASIRGRENETLKAFLSAKKDSFRPPYGRANEDFERRAVFAGTTNPDGDGYLNDRTGARRYWPVKVGRVDALALSRDRNQLWAEAVACYRHYLAEVARGVQPDDVPIPFRWWFTADEQPEADAVAAERRTEDTWASAILSWHSKLAPNYKGGPWSLEDIAREVLQIDRADLRRHERALAGALCDAGFERKRLRTEKNANPKRLWYPPGAPADPALHS